MDFKDQIKQLADRVDKLKDGLQTEEATKMALVAPFIQALGYNVFDPNDVCPEFTCDIGTKKGEKIDYAIFKDGQPIILIECKHWKQPLTLHDNQLLRYYHVSPAKFGVLTNGICYRFYTDLETPNKMDEVPFLEIDMTDIRSNQIEELKKFHKAGFDVDKILSSASELKYTGELRALISKEFANPSNELVKLWAKQVYDGTMTQKVLEQFVALVRKSLSNHVNDIISERLKSALKTETTEEQPDVDTQPLDDKEDNGVVTTEEELEAFYIVKSILRPEVSSDKITYRDAKTYFAILFDDNNRKPICRLYLNSASNKQIAFVTEDKKETRYKIDSLDDIYQYRDELINTVGKYK